MCAVVGTRELIQDREFLNAFCLQRATRECSLCTAQSAGSNFRGTLIVSRKEAMASRPKGPKIQDERRVHRSFSARAKEKEAGSTIRGPEIANTLKLLMYSLLACYEENVVSIIGYQREYVYQLYRDWGRRCVAAFSSFQS